MGAGKETRGGEERGVSLTPLCALPQQRGLAGGRWHGLLVRGAWEHPLPQALYTNHFVDGFQDPTLSSGALHDPALRPLISVPPTLSSDPAATMDT